MDATIVDVLVAWTAGVALVVSGFARRFANAAPGPLLPTSRLLPLAVATAASSNGSPSHEVGALRSDCSVTCGYGPGWP